MTDRELLEMAAKAAGFNVRCVGDGHLGGNVVFYMEPSQLYWNPLTDDGDAFRLAVRLGMNVFHAAKRAYALDEDGVTEVFEPHTSNRDAATRRAIVRAAAEIGKGME